MKINGDVPGTNCTRFVIRRQNGRAWEFELYALPLGFMTQLESDIPDPRPPETFAREHGRVLRDDTGTPIKHADPHNPRYLVDLERARSLRSYAVLVQAAGQDARIQFDAQPSSFPTRREYLEAIESELAAAGITDAEVYLMVSRVHDLNRGHVDRIEARAESFLSETPAHPDGNSQTPQDEPRAT